MNNSLFTLHPTCSHGIWSFDDVNTGLKGEPFVGETNDLIDCMAVTAGWSLRKARNGITIMFGATPFPNYDCVLELQETAPHGTTYRCDKYDLFPWLCPAMFKYFPTAPSKMYVAVLPQK